MDPNTITTLIEGGPYGLAALGWLAWYWERKKHSETTDRLFDLSHAQVKATTKQEGAIRANTEVMRFFLDKG